MQKKHFNFSRTKYFEFLCQNNIHMFSFGFLPEKQKAGLII